MASTLANSFWQNTMGRLDNSIKMCPIVKPEPGGCDRINSNRRENKIRVNGYVGYYALLSRNYAYLNI